MDDSCTSRSHTEAEIRCTDLRLLAVLLADWVYRITTSVNLYIYIYIYILSYMCIYRTMYHFKQHVYELQMICFQIRACWLKWPGSHVVGDARQRPARNGPHLASTEGEQSACGGTHMNNKIIKAIMIKRMCHQAKLFQSIYAIIKSMVNNR